MHRRQLSHLRFWACFGTHWFTNGNAKKIGAANVLYTEKNGARVIISILYSDAQEIADKPQTSEPAAHLVPALPRTRRRSNFDTNININSWQMQLEGI